MPDADVKPTFCRLCEPLCGLLATVEQGRLVSLRPDPDHPLSRGQACPKGIAFTEVQNDPDRVLRPLRRRPDGTFEELSWEAALDDVAARLRRIWDEAGGAALGSYLGNPPAFSYSAPVWLGLLCRRLGVVHQFTSGSQDINSRFVASKLLYGAASQLPFPDLPRTDFLFMLGANPHVSHGSALTAPRIKDELTGVVARGGRVVVVDPRRTETARAYEHVPVRPDGDAWLLLSMLQVIFAEGLVDRAALAEQTSGADWLERVVAGHPPELTEPQSGVPAEVVRDVARGFATARGAAAYGRTGACLGRHGTLVNYLLDALSVVTGNLDRAGGTLFAHGVIPLEDIAERAGMMTYGTSRSRVGGFPDVMGIFPAATMADEITTPGPGRLRALIVTGGNPVLTVPDGARLAAALDRLDLLVSLDLYVNETNRHAHYVLPTTTFLEREDLPGVLAATSVRPFFQATDAVVQPYGEARQEWQIYEELLHRMGLAVNGRGTGILNRAMLTLERRGVARVTPGRIFDVLLRVGRFGDWYGLRRGGLSVRQALAAHPHGVVLRAHAATGRRKHAVRHRHHKVRLDPPEIVTELARLGDRHPADPDYPLRLIGMREMRSLNSWLHNTPTLMKGKRLHAARINPIDAAAAGLVDGGQVRVVSPLASIVTHAIVTDDVGPGTVAVPHGWGHGGGWRRANAAGGANVNLLMSGDAGDLERLAGMAVLNGVAVRLEPVPS
jgi:anaerobic selenocysteine-containing dehydrogenase